MRVAIVVMPFAAADSPSLAAGLLKAELAERGIACDVKHFNVTFALLAGARDYERISKQFQSASLAGEWVFSQQYYENRISDWESYDRDVLAHPLWGAGDGDREVIRRMLALAPAFLQVAYASTDWSRYDLVGFTSTFEQTMPAMCLAREIRRNHPGVLIAAGGANFESVMGPALMETFTEIDFVCDGEGDVSFPALCEAIRDRSSVVPPGIRHRRNGAIDGTRRPGGFTELDSLPDPDFDDYFRVIESSTPRLPVAWIPVEASRGCWWGQKAHCTLCGLNGEAMTCRHKGWRRIAELCARLVARYDPPSLQFTDNILATGYFRDLLPHWAATRDDTPKFFELKSNLTRTQVSLLRSAGILCAQAGIESLADSTLALMRKGVSAAQNVATLRWLAEHDILANWNVIFGFPGEAARDLGAQHDLLRKLVHLDPPSFCGVIRLDRFSPNFTSWRELGFSSIRPMPAYQHVFDMPEARLADAAYFFEFDHPGLSASIDAALPMIALTDEWRTAGRVGSRCDLELLPHVTGGTVVVDRRFTSDAATHRLDATGEAWMLACDAPVAPPAAHARVEEAAGPCAGPTAGESLEWLMRAGIIAEVGPRLVTLAIMRDNVRSIIGEDRSPTLVPTTEEERRSEWRTT